MSQRQRARQANQENSVRNPSYLRRNGLPLGLFLAGLGFILPRYFWFGVACVVSGGGLLAIDVWKESIVRKQGRINRVMFWVLFSFVGIIFLFWLFHRVPLQLTASSMVPRYGAGSTVFGIPWSDSYAELQFKLRNPSSIDYDNFDVHVSTDLTIEGLRMIGGLAPCSVAPSGEQSLVTTQKFVGDAPVGPAKPDDKQYTVLNLLRNGEVSYSGDIAREYRIRCDRLAANSESNFVAALSVMNPLVNGRPPSILRAPPRPVAWCTIKATFETLGRPRSITISNCKIGQACGN